MIFSGIAGASAWRVKSAMRWIWQKRAFVARGKLGLKIEPFGAITLTGRSILVLGDEDVVVASSRKIVRTMYVAALSTAPS